MEIFGFVAAVFIGIVLGLIGGGGSILAVPVLVYLFDIEPQLATTYSLFVVGCSAFVGVFNNYKTQTLEPKTAFVFAIPSIISLLFVRNFILPMIPHQFAIYKDISVAKGNLIIFIFAILMVFSAISMIKKQTETNAKLHVANQKILVVIAILIGALVGFLGAGGGFLIVPALVIFAKLDIKQSVGTSLLIIAINSTIGFSADAISGIQINFKFLLFFTSFAIFGMFIGTSLTKKIDSRYLKPIFGWFVLLMGIFIISKEILF